MPAGPTFGVFTVTVKSPTGIPFATLIDAAKFSAKLSRVYTPVAVYNGLRVKSLLCSINKLNPNKPIR